MKRRVLLLADFLATLILPLFPINSVHADVSTTSPAIIIDQIKLGGNSTSPEEYVTLFNAGKSAVTSLDGWSLEYINANSGFDSTHCQDASWAVSDNQAKSIPLPTISEFQPDQLVTIPTAADRTFNDNTNGSIHLVDSSGTVQDLVGWGEEAPCSETAPAQTPTTNSSTQQSIERLLDCAQSFPVDTNNNSSDFATVNAPAPESLGDQYVANCQTGPTQQNNNPINECNGLAVSEIGANLDDSQQFIEVYNSTNATLDISGCQLQTNRSTTRSYNFENQALAPQAYFAVYIKDTNLLLTKTTTGTVYIVSSDGNVTSSESYSNLSSDTSWAWFGETDWRETYAPTPDSANIWQQFPPCAAGQVRNTGTGRCDNIATLTISTLTPCQQGQVRNPDTNRCRAIASSTSTGLTPCKLGQQRNPATNRCKAIATTASASLKPCAAGQERNPETHRCRKVSAISATSLGDTKDSSAGSTSGGGHLWIAVLAMAGALGYGIYEWRQEFWQFVSKFKKQTAL